MLTQPLELRTFWGKKQKAIGNLSAGTVSDGLNENVDEAFSETNRAAARKAWLSYLAKFCIHGACDIAHRKL